MLNALHVGQLAQQPDGRCRVIGDLSLRKATLAGLSGAYGNIGYMGPGLALAVLGTKASAPTALIFCCDSIFLFSIVPILIAFTDREHRSLLHTFGIVVRQIVLNPLIMSAGAGALLNVNTALAFPRSGAVMRCVTDPSLGCQATTS